jgi:phosphoribosylanthranilate isomerase
MNIKICGITRIEDAEFAVGGGADMIGFIFAKSPRQVEPKKVKQILDRLEAKSLRGKVRAVGVFVNESHENIRKIVSSTGIDLLQIHGDEPAEFCNAIDFPWMRALRVDERLNAESFRDTLRELTCQEILVDARVEGLYGGSGKRIAEHVSLSCLRIAHDEGKKFYLAGGITPENALSVKNEIKPDGIDLSSALEVSPGIKSHEKMKRLFDQLG